MPWHGGTPLPTPPRYAGPYTFAHVPHRQELDGVDVALVGVPFDTAAGYRVGARFGPGAVRAASGRLRPYNESLDVYPFQVLNCVDHGDAPTLPGETAATLDRVTEFVTAIVRAGVVPGVIGGDHSQSLAHTRAVAAGHGPVALVQFDAHTDCADTIMGLRYSHGTWVRRAVEEGLIDVGRSIQIGLRGPVGDPAERAAVREELGIDYVTADEFFEAGAAAVGRRARELVAEGPAYVSFDIDALDPSAAPGTGTPEIGGLTTRDAQVVLRALAGARLVGFDLMEVSPPYDHAELTSTAAAGLLFELLSVLALARPPAPRTERTTS